MAKKIKYKIPKKYRGDRARVIMDCPAHKIKEIMGVIQGYAAHENIIILAVAHLGIIEKEPQQKMRKVINNVLKTKDTKSIDSLELTEEYATIEPKAKVIKKREIPYIG